MLDTNEDRPNQLYRLKPGWILQCKLSASVPCRKNRLFTNAQFNSNQTLGSMNEWLSRFEVTFHGGYNFIHFTLIQELDHVSNSSDAIINHHR